MSSSSTLTRESYEAFMKGMLVKSTTVCEKRCVRSGEEEHVSNFELACLGKCFDKFFTMSEHNTQAVVHALQPKKKDSDYD
jgi:hypothetical protein